MDKSEKTWKLCYIENNFAWFTTAALEDQSGDDWDNSPYEHNAGEPCEWVKHRGCSRYELCKLAFDCDLYAPCDRTGEYSVLNINRGITSWLASWWGSVTVDTAIYAGCSIEEFKAKIHAVDGKIYTLEEE